MATSGLYRHNAIMTMCPVGTLSSKKDSNVHEQAVLFCAVRKITTVESVTWVQVKKTLIVYKLVLGRISTNTRLVRVIKMP